MEWLIIVALGVAIYQLYQRLQRVEARLQDLEQAPFAQYAPPVAAEPDVPANPSTDQTFDRAAAKTATDEDMAAQSAPLARPKMAAAKPSPAKPAPQTKTFAPYDPKPEPEPEPRKPLRERFDFEDIFGRKLPVWAGGAALAVAGVFLVMYSIEAGLLTPAVRVALSFVFGILLLAGAEAAFRFEHKVADPRIRQALAGAGIATLFAAFYLAGAQYALIGPAIAFAGLAGVTALAIGLTSRFGLPTAVLGLVGGFATPALVASDEANIPVLAFYLALLTAGLTLTGRRLGILWLGIGALTGGFGWGVLMLLTAPVASADQLTIGLYLLALGAVVPMLAGATIAVPYMRLLAGALASVQLAVLVTLAGFELLTWGLYLLLAAALAVLAWRTENLRIGNGFAAATGLVLLAAWPDPTITDFAIVGIGLGAVALLVPLALLWRVRALATDLAQLVVGAAGLAAAACWHFGSGDNDMFQPALAAAVAVIGIIAALAGVKLWRGGPLAHLLPAPVGVAALLGFAALHLLLPDWAEIAGAAAISLVLAQLLRWRREMPLAALVWAAAFAAFMTLLSTGEMLAELGKLVGYSDSGHDLPHALMRWGAATLPFLALAMLEWRKTNKFVAEALFAALAYGFAAQIVPAGWLASLCALAAIIAAWRFRERKGALFAVLAIGALWSIPVLADWSIDGLEALAGAPMLLSGLPDWQDILRHAMPFAVASGFVLWTGATAGRKRIVLASAAGFAIVVAAHVVFKQLFAIDDNAAFIATGLAERTVWQALLVAGGIALAHFSADKRVNYGGAVMVTLGLTHFALFSLLLHNPMTEQQAVGSLPVANLLLPSFAIAGVAVWWLAERGADTDRFTQARIVRDVVLMALISVLALSLLRQGFAGSILTDLQISQSENLLRSMLGIVLALGFLFWGSRKDARSWRIGSLVLMLLAVLKVFLVDAAGLEGLLRIASFLALGFSLIGIGWVYSRQLTTHQKGT